MREIWQVDPSIWFSSSYKISSKVIVAAIFLLFENIFSLPLLTLVRIKVINYIFCRTKFFVVLTRIFQVYVIIDARGPWII